MTASRHPVTTDIAAALMDIEVQLRRLGQWDKIPPSTEALASTQPFCVDTLTLPQWLQFIFVPSMQRLLEQQVALPDKCAIAPLAEEFYRGSELPVANLIDTLQRIDALLSARQA